MSYQILDGKKLADKILSGCRHKIKQENIKVNLAVILVGDNPVSKQYIKIKKQRCEEMGINLDLITFVEDISEGELIKKIYELNNSKTTGIMVQLPLPNGLNTNKIINTILVEKDVDGLTAAAMEKLENGDESIVCCTPKGIIRLLEQNNIDLNHKKIVIVGHGNLVGKPLSLMLKNRKLKFTICDEKTKNLKSKTKKADILISATGVPHLIKSDYIKKGVIIVDAGTAKLNNKILGDVDFDDVKNKTSFITPVPGGVGPITIAMLIENIVDMGSKKI